MSSLEEMEGLKYSERTESSSGAGAWERARQREAWSAESKFHLLLDFA